MRRFVPRRQLAERLGQTVVYATRMARVRAPAIAYKKVCPAKHSTTAVVTLRYWATHTIFVFERFPHCAEFRLDFCNELPFGDIPQPNRYSRSALRAPQSSSQRGLSGSGRVRTFSKSSSAQTNSGVRTWPMPTSRIALRDSVAPSRDSQPRSPCSALCACAWLRAALRSPDRARV